jgi:3-hydroxybutyryl-CoA dehydratase
MLGPVFLGDTVTVTYTVADIDEERLRSRAKIEVKNQHGELVTVGEHILKWVPRVKDGAAVSA